MAQNSASEVDSPGESPYTLDFCERFEEKTLCKDRWVSHYLPHWTTPERSAARYALVEGSLRLEIRADQPAWLPTDSSLRVSNIQTGTFSGPYGSPRGQHKHRTDLTVQSPQPSLHLYTPVAPARVEATLRACTDPSCMLAFWLVGFQEESAKQAGEICVVELFGNKIGADKDAVGGELSLGVKKHSDPDLHDDVEKIVIAGLNTSEWHTYAAEWDDQVKFYVDGKLVKSVRQSMKYPLQMMIDLFEFPAEGLARDPAYYPKVAYVRDALGYRRL